MAPTPRQLAAAANAHSQQLAMQQQQQQMAELQRQQQQNRAQNAAAMPLYDPDQLPPLPGKPGLREDTPERVEFRESGATLTGAQEPGDGCGCSHGPRRHLGSRHWRA